MSKRIINLMIVLTLIGACVLSFSSCSQKSEPENLGLTAISIDNKLIGINKGDYVEADAWSEEPFVCLNEDTYDHYPVLMGDITIGSDVKDVVKAFELNGECCKIDSEIPTAEHDGTTEVINTAYSDSFFDSAETYSYLDALLCFGYKKDGDKWVQIPADNIEDEAELIYMIDINGMDDQSVDFNKVIQFRIEYRK